MFKINNFISLVPDRLRIFLARHGLAPAGYDFFISYKWSTYTQEAEQMCALARKQGYKVLIDRNWLPENPADERPSNDAIAEQLRWALGACGHVIFFETHATLAATENGPSHRRLSWQENELEMIKIDGRKTI